MITQNKKTTNLRNSGPVSLENGSLKANIESYCKLLSLSSVATNYESAALDAAKAKLSYQDYLYKLLQQQIIDRVDRSVNARIKKAGFKYLATLEEFDFSFQPQIDEKLIRELATLSFLDSATNILLLGAPGVGKTHLSIAIGLEATKQRRRVKFINAEDLTNELIAANRSNTLTDYLESMSRVELLIIDEIGYLELSKETSSLFFRLISKRYEKASTIITSNKEFQEWGSIFNDDVIATAILDRLLHHSHPFLINGPSYRMKDLLPTTKNKKQTTEKNNEI
ncbi:IS21-like element helper ATPase IstB [Aliarcobacter cibarius]|jgi:DNA replication protein DnaC|uniref:AAA family ATPase n=1 Tax=Aliarcobacter cibarius TaxID=255507 RepID=A0ABY2V1R6_9BACT|nr:IS21-like element helper ATPase IstB [Aliarcobacter cibarius]TLS95096.1 AAA family ATPase [Aliarcobacter cibarius]TLS95536.1 AAA family ATPase [Aliarcobacter cibarius]